MNVQPIQARLRTQVPALLLVGGAAEYERAVQGLATMPAAFVMPARERPQPNEFGNQIVQQQVNVDVAVLLAVRNLADDEGNAATQSLEPVRVACRDALLNWQPDSDAFGCEFAGGDFLAFQNGVLWWRDDYRTSYVVRSQ